MSVALDVVNKILEQAMRFGESPDDRLAKMKAAIVSRDREILNMAAGVCGRMRFQCYGDNCEMDGERAVHSKECRAAQEALEECQTKILALAGEVL